MEVILLQDIENLGKEGTLVNVKDGYARNFLIPRKLAAVSTPSVTAMLERKKKQKAADEAKSREEARALAKKLEALSLTISVEAGVEDKIFGSVTSEMIRNALRTEGVELDKKLIVLEEPIKQLGIYQVPVKLHSDVPATIKVWVVKK
ncbi:MAG: 50S ribosomal protein L9 [Candidatus Omnitrophica bacterium]|nr:50S ribosomal protein L9 [Candidatus Omnitrophota bacterium]